MPPKQKGGNNTRRFAPKQLPMIYATQGQFYGTVDSVLGNCQFKITTETNEQRTASLSGAVKRNGRITAGDYVLIEALGDNEKGKYQIIFKYTQDQKKQLQKEGKLITLIETPVKEETINLPPKNDIEFDVEDAKEKSAQSQTDLINELFIDCI
jgi:initiation factor 1A